jgi:hypothetical protein
MRANSVTLHESDWTKAARLFSEGLTFTQIAERFGVTRNAIRHGLASRKRLLTVLPIETASASPTTAPFAESSAEAWPSP